MPKRYPRARSQMHVRTLKARGLQPVKFQSDRKQGPFSLSIAEEFICHHCGLTHDRVAEALEIAAAGHVVRFGGQLIAAPAGTGQVYLSENLGGRGR